MAERRPATGFDAEIVDLAALYETPVRVHRPVARTVPLVFSSPHGGRAYPRPFVTGARLDPLRLRMSEDAFIDRLYDFVPQLGAPLLEAHFPRAFLDANREPFELDPLMFDAPLPTGINTTSPRVRSGLGTIARVVAHGAEIYRDKLSFEDARQRVDGLYWPFHQALHRLITEAVDTFGCALLVDCHSMPSNAGPGDNDNGTRRADMVLGDCFGTAASRVAVETAERALTRLGYTVALNRPYAGGHITAHYGRPGQGVHALQIEVRRDLYMDEKTLRPNAGFETLRRNLQTLTAALAGIDAAMLRPQRPMATGAE